MQFHLLFFTFVLASGLRATPLTVRDTAVTSGPTIAYTELYREKASIEDGYLIYFGLNDNSTNTNYSEPDSLEKRAPCSRGGNLGCSSDHTARNDVCDSLVQELQADYNVPVKESPRQICYLGQSAKNSYCCVSWHNPVPGLTKGNLYDIAYNMFTHCTQNGISGKTNSVYVHGVCTSVCLSDRGTHC